MYRLRLFRSRNIVHIITPADQTSPRTGVIKILFGTIVIEEVVILHIHVIIQMHGCQKLIQNTHEIKDSPCLCFITVIPLTEDSGSYSDKGSALFDSCLKVSGHTHAELRHIYIIDVFSIDVNR